jgi:hypothetical protein
MMDHVRLAARFLGMPHHSGVDYLISREDERQQRGMAEGGQPSPEEVTVRGAIDPKSVSHIDPALLERMREYTLAETVEQEQKPTYTAESGYIRTPRGYAEGGESDPSAMEEVSSWMRQHQRDPRLVERLMEPFYGLDESGNIRFLGGGPHIHATSVTMGRPMAMDELRSLAGKVGHFMGASGLAEGTVDANTRLEQLRQAIENRTGVGPPREPIDYLTDMTAAMTPLPGLEQERMVRGAGSLAERLAGLRKMGELNQLPGLSAIGQLLTPLGFMPPRAYPEAVGTGAVLSALADKLSRSPGRENGAGETAAEAGGVEPPPPTGAPEDTSVGKDIQKELGEKAYQDYLTKKYVEEGPSRSGGMQSGGRVGKTLSALEKAVGLFNEGRRQGSLDPEQLNDIQHYMLLHAQRQGISLADAGEQVKRAARAGEFSQLRPADEYISSFPMTIGMEINPRDTEALWSRDPSHMNDPEYHLDLRGRIQDALDEQNLGHLMSGVSVTPRGVTSGPGGLSLNHAVELRGPVADLDQIAEVFKHPEPGMTVPTPERYQAEGGAVEMQAGGQPQQQAAPPNPTPTEDSLLNDMLQRQILTRQTAPPAPMPQMQMPSLMAGGGKVRRL